MKKCLCVLLFHICLLPKMLWAQDNKDSLQLSWLRLGLGGANNAPAANISYNYQQKHILYSLQATYAFHNLLNNHESTFEFCPIVGYTGEGKYMRFSASTGIALIYTTFYRFVPPVDWRLLPRYEAYKSRADFGVPVITQIRFPLGERYHLSFSGQHTFSTNSFSAFTFGADIKLND